MLEPKKHLTNTAFPHDLYFVPRIFVIGLPKTGKTTLCNKIQEHLNVVRVSMADVLKESLDRPEGLIAREASDTLRSGKMPSDMVCL